MNNPAFRKGLWQKVDERLERHWRASAPNQIVAIPNTRQDVDFIIVEIETNVECVHKVAKVVQRVRVCIRSLPKAKLLIGRSLRYITLCFAEVYVRRILANQLSNVNNVRIMITSSVPR